MKRSGHLLALAFFFSALTPEAAHAYIGPGAGFAFLGSAAVFLMTLVLAVITISFWPLQWAWRKARGKGVSKRAKARRVIIVGLDGLEPKLADQYIAEGRLPNLAKLKVTGTYERLKTTLPALSPVAWSTFQTGVNPGAHNIFDFLTRDKRFVLPELSSTKTTTEERTIGFGPFRMKRERGAVKLLRMSQPFWRILGKHGVFSNVIRVPISYPPEKFNGNILSAMCTPDLKGTQGSFSLFSDRDSGDRTTGGEVQHVTVEGNTVRAALEGPRAGPDKPPLTSPFSLMLRPERGEAELRVAGSKETVILKLNEFSPWVEVRFQAGKKSITGICRFCLRELTPNFSLYVSPININPKKPVLPIAQPILFAQWLAKRFGYFGTLGLMEDTWGRNELALDDERFLAQTYLTHAEREEMFFETLARTKEGLCLCVFDASDRIQHMFWRYLEPNHPSPVEDRERFGHTVREMYERMDALVGKVVSKLRPTDCLIILSDHGFAPFRRGINLNTWLKEQNLLGVKSNTGADFFGDVEWKTTKAFGVGLTGIYLNRKGRELQGTLDDAQAEIVKTKIIAGLESLRDPKTGEQAILKVYDARKEYCGLYTNEAPDLIVGYAPGYRVSWDSITGMIESEVFSDNIKAWSGDHHVDPTAVPGVLFSNWKLKAENAHIADIAPTVLDIFAVPAPRYMEGKILARA